MGKPCSMDLRERVIRRVEAGESRRSVARTFEPGEATVIRWLRRWRQTESYAPGQMGGHRPYLTWGAFEHWLHRRIKSGAFTRRGITFEPAERGLRVDERRVCAFVRRAGRGFKRNRAGNRTETAKGGAVSGAVEAVPGWG